VESTLTDLKFALSEGVTHLSLYQLTLEPGTLLRARVESGQRARPIDAAQTLQMDAAIEFLETSGYRRYEISNFSQGKKQALHNLIYWTGRPYLGLGVSAHAYTGRRRFFHPRSLEKYMSADYHLAEDTAVSRRDVLINWLRLRRPMRIDAIAGLFTADQKGRVSAIVDRALARGWVERNKDLVSLTHEGLKYSDSLLSELWGVAGPD
jgi:oxygen-independent coproporphyrinogen-3 oxidase